MPGGTGIPVELLFSPSRHQAVNSLVTGKKPFYPCQQRASCWQAHYVPCHSTPGSPRSCFLNSC